LPDNLVELPEVEEEFKIEIGKKYLGRVLGGGNFKECKVVHIDGPDVLALFKNSRDEYCQPEWCEYVEPLHTEEEKAKEAFIVKALDIMLDVSGEIDSNSIGALFDEGARFKEPEAK
jgi:hypothetical protein